MRLTHCFFILCSKLRPDLRVLITSATLDGEKFAQYFGDCPVIRVPGKCHQCSSVYVAFRL